MDRLGDIRPGVKAAVVLYTTLSFKSVYNILQQVTLDKPVNKLKTKADIEGKLSCLNFSPWETG